MRMNLRASGPTLVEKGGPAPLAPGSLGPYETGDDALRGQETEDFKTAIISN